MATAAPLTPGAPAPVLIGVGGFGEGTVRLLREEFGHAETVPADECARAFRAGRGPVVLAAWRPEPALFERADALAYASARPWLPIVLETLAVRAGPVIRPPYGPCFRCYRERRAQHDRQGATASVLLDAYDADPDLGPRGFLPHHARLAAALAAAFLRPSAETGDRGLVRTFRLTEWGIDTSHVVPWHGCPRCGTDSTAGAGAGPERLAAALAPSPSDATPTRPGGAMPVRPGGATPAQPDGAMVVRPGGPMPAQPGGVREAAC